MDFQAIKQLEGFANLEQGTKDLALRIQIDQSELMQALEAHALTISAQDITTKDLIKFEHEWTRKAILESINGTNVRESESEDGEKLHLIKEMLLESLQFATMMDRFEDVQPAHQKTYEWIFKAPDADPESIIWSDFPRWLCEGDGTYWINGKAASGKSTIMRYICDNADATRAMGPGRTRNYSHTFFLEQRNSRAAILYWITSRPYIQHTSATQGFDTRGIPPRME